jgi:hypothetical protein
MCTESGLWEHVHFSCIFDPALISVEDGGFLEGN